MNNLQDPSTVFVTLCNSLMHGVPTFSKFMRLVDTMPTGSVFIAGGAVRDAFLQPDSQLKDLDIFLDNTAFQIIQGFLQQEGTLERNQFGTYRWFGHSDKNVYYDIIIIEKFHNGLWTCRNITDVLNQFDITVNAIAFDLKDGALHDPENGMRDIQEKILRAVRFDYPELMVSPEIPLSRNTVLWFRYQHYRKTLDLSFDRLTQRWIKENSFRESELGLFTQHFFSPYLDHV